jgi:hypothetical protein
VRAVVALAGFNNNVSVFVLIDIVANQAKTILDIIGEETEFD